MKLRIIKHEGHWGIQYIVEQKDIFPFSWYQIGPVFTTQQGAEDFVKKMNAVKYKTTVVKEF